MQFKNIISVEHCDVITTEPSYATLDINVAQTANIKIQNTQLFQDIQKLKQNNSILKALNQQFNDFEYPQERKTTIALLEREMLEVRQDVHQLKLELQSLIVDLQ